MNFVGILKEEIRSKGANDINILLVLWALIKRHRQNKSVFKIKSYERNCQRKLCLMLFKLYIQADILIVFGDDMWTNHNRTIQIRGVLETYYALSFYYRLPFDMTTCLISSDIYSIASAFNHETKHHRRLHYWTTVRRNHNTGCYSAQNTRPHFT